MYGVRDGGSNGRLAGRCIPDSMFTRPAARNLWKLFAAISISRIHASDLSLSLSLPPSRSSRLSRSRTGRHPAGPRAPIVLPATCRNFHTATRMLSNKVGTEIISRWLCSIYPGSYSTFSFGPTFVRCFARLDRVFFSGSGYCTWRLQFWRPASGDDVWNGWCWFELFEVSV